MLISRPGTVLLLAALMLPVNGAFSLEANLTPGEAFRMGYKSYKAGDTETALEALNFAADQGHTAALWKLGKMHAGGDGVPLDNGKAFEIFMRIAGDSAETNPRSRDARYIADALVSLGRYYETGIPEKLAANPSVARQIFSHTAAYFSNADAQYELARMTHQGIGGDKNTRQAARWYKLAARKGHAGAQAQFGVLLLNGDGMKKNSVKGLMWLSLARRKAAGNSNIVELHQQAFSAAPENDRETAMAMADKWLERRLNK